MPTKEVIATFLERLPPTDHVGLVFVGRSDLSVGPTSDRRRLTDAVGRLREAVGFGLDAAPIPTSGGSIAKKEALSYARAAAFVLANVTRALAESRHARRAVVYVSGGSMLDPSAPIRTREYTESRIVHDDLKKVFDLATNSGVPIFTLDPRGVVVPEDAMRGDQTHRGPAFRAEVSRRIAIQQDYLRNIAAETGGKAFVRQGDLGAAVDGIVAANEAFYVIGYSSDSPPDTARTLEIVVNRPGAKVLARRLAASTSLQHSADAGLLESALESAVDVAAIPLTVSVVPLAERGGKRRAIVSIQVIYPASVEGARIEDTVRTAILALDGDAKVRSSSERAFTIRASPKGSEDFSFLIQDVIEAPANRLVFRVGVASDALRRAGTVSVPVDLTAGATAFDMSPLVLGFAAGPREPALGADAARSVLPWQPTTIRAFDRGDVVRVLTFLSPSRRAKPAQATLTVRASAPDGESVWTGRFAFRELPEPMMIAEAEVPFAAFAPGRYVLEAVASSADGVSRTQTLAFRIK